MAGGDCGWEGLCLGVIVAGGDPGRSPLLLRDWGPGRRQSLGVRREEMEECASSVEASVSLFLIVPELPLNQSSSWLQLLVCVMFV